MSHTPEQLAIEMRELADKFGSDPEVCHMRMEALLTRTLRSLGFDDACDVYDDQPMWYA